ncbi:MAG: DNA polymerase III subunit [Aggregatilineales bacterium]
MAIYSTDWGVAGHEWAVTHLARSLANDRLRHAYLITGPSGVGKSTLALGLACAANCLSEIRPCGHCRACRLILAGSYADVSLIRAEDKTLKIDQIREMQRTLALRPVEARYRVVILENFHEASGGAADALLKTLEEPPPSVILILTAERADGLSPTIRSRCQPLALRPLPAGIVRAELEKRGLAEGEQALLLAQLSGGRLGWALHAAGDETALTERTSALDMLEAAVSAERIGRFQTAERLAVDAKDRLPDILALWQSYWRDVLLLVSAAPVEIVNRDRRHMLEQLAAGLHIDDVTRVLASIRSTARYLEQNVNARLALEVLMLDLPRLRLFAAPPH